MKFPFRIFHICLLLLASISAVYFFSFTRESHWLALGVVALPPLVQKITPYDSIQTHGKLRLPKVSLMVLLGIALLLLTAPGAEWSLLLGLLCLGSYLLDTYWASVK